MTRSHKTKFRFVGAHVDDLADGRILEPGGFYELTTDEQADAHNRRHIDNGRLIEATGKKED